MSCPLSPEEGARAEALIERCRLVSLHEHLGVFPARIEETPEYVRHGRMATAFRGLAASHWDCVFDNLMDGICTIHSRSGWQWDDVLHDLGMRLCDLAHQDFVIHCLRVADIHRAHDEGRVALVASMEGAAMIEHEVGPHRPPPRVRRARPGHHLLRVQRSRATGSRSAVTAVSPRSVARPWSA